MANVVLPSPGGPSKRICPSGSLRLCGGIDGDFQPGVDLALADHVAHPLRAKIAIFVRRIDRPLRDRLCASFWTELRPSRRPAV